MIQVYEFKPEDFKCIFNQFNLGSIPAAQDDTLIHCKCYLNVDWFPSW